MPVKACNEGGKPGFKWGDQGKCYTYEKGNEDGMKKCKQKAYLQGFAATGGKMDADVKNWSRKSSRAFTVISHNLGDRLEGGPDSGNFGHSGRPGLIGGSGGGGNKGSGKSVAKGIRTPEVIVEDIKKVIGDDWKLSHDSEEISITSKTKAPLMLHHGVVTKIMKAKIDGIAEPKVISEPFGKNPSVIVRFK